MTFNIAAHNRDDHAKNFAFMMSDAGEWSLSPAYDLGFAHGPGGEHTMTVAGEGRDPTRAHVLQIAKQFGIRTKETIGIFEQVNSAIARWHRFADEAGCTKKRTREVASFLKPI